MSGLNTVLFMGLKGLCTRTFLDPISKNISTCTAVKICGHWKRYVPRASQWLRRESKWFGNSHATHEKLTCTFQLMLYP